MIRNPPCSWRYLRRRIKLFLFVGAIGGTLVFMTSPSPSNSSPPSQDAVKSVQPEQYLTSPDHPPSDVDVRLELERSRPEPEPEPEPEPKEPLKSEPGIVLRTFGGLGSQLFFYACHYSMAKALGWPLHFIQHFDDQPWRNFMLDNFQIPGLTPEPDVFKTFTGPINLRGSGEQFLYKIRPPKPQLLSLNSIHFCQSEDYFKDYEKDIRRMFRLRPEVLLGVREWAKWMLAEIEGANNSVAVHVRRGGDHNGGIRGVPLSFQLRAMKKMESLLEARRSAKPTFFIFTDEIERLKRDLRTNSSQIVFVSSADFRNDPDAVQRNSIAEFYMMSRCKHQIVPDSSFSWWAAYLNENKEKIVIASGMGPNFFSKENRWVMDSPFNWKEFKERYLPKEWIYLPP